MGPCRSLCNNKQHDNNGTNSAAVDVVLLLLMLSLMLMLLLMLLLMLFLTMMLAMTDKKNGDDFTTATILLAFKVTCRGSGRSRASAR
jgi:hypothetical protein